MALPSNDFRLAVHFHQDSGSRPSNSSFTRSMSHRLVSRDIGEATESVAVSLTRKLLSKNKDANYS
jgi:hypothetical protein